MKLKDFITTIEVDNKLEDIFEKDTEVLEGIEESIITSGYLAKEPFYINKRLDGSEVLLDGHTRRLACLNQLSHIKDDCEAVIITLELQGDTAEELWIRTHQIKRRNLSNTQSNENKLAIGRLYNQSKKEIGRPNQLNKSATHSTLNSTSQNIGKEFGLGESTIRKYATLDNQINEMAENLCPKKLTDDTNDREAYVNKITEQFTSGAITATTLGSMSKVSGSPLHKDKVKKALQAFSEGKDINTTWKDLKSKPLNPPSKDLALPSSPPSSDDLTETKEALEKLLDNSIKSSIDVNSSSYKTVKNKIELLTKELEFEEDGETITNTAIFLYEIRCLTSDYFRNRMNAFNIIKNEMNSE